MKRVTQDSPCDYSYVDFFPLSADWSRQTLYGDEQPIETLNVGKHVLISKVVISGEASD